MPKYTSERSIRVLNELNIDLQILFNYVIKEVDNCLICGERGRRAQEQALWDGKSRAVWKASPHNYTPSPAVDFIPWPFKNEWEDKSKFKPVVDCIKYYSLKKGIDVSCGYDWEKFNGDFGHIELANWENIAYRLVDDGEICLKCHLWKCCAVKEKKYGCVYRTSKLIK